MANSEDEGRGRSQTEYAKFSMQCKTSGQTEEKVVLDSWCLVSEVPIIMSIIARHTYKHKQETKRQKI